jgi:hypothetical protein
MAIAPMPGRKRRGGSEVAAAKFIEGATSPTRGVRGGESATARKQPAMIRFAPELLARVDQAARRRGISRSAWIAFTLSKALDDEG